MATKSRLGRDPLNGAAKPVATQKASHSAPNPKKPKKAPAKAAPETAAPGKTAPSRLEAMFQPVEATPHEAKPVKAAPGAPPAATAPTAPAAPEQTTDAPALEVQPIPVSVQIPEGYAEPAAFGTADYAPGALEEMAETTASGIQPIPVSKETPDGYVIPTSFETAEYTSAFPERMTDTPLSEGPHPAEVFLRGVLENLALEGGLTLRIDVDPETFGLPVEKLFYFSHVLQLLVSPLESPSNAWRRSHDSQGPQAVLTVRLHKMANDRHSLRIFDNGLFFSQYLSDIRLQVEALRPLVLFVIKRRGSICLKQARCVEFEIIG